MLDALIANLPPRIPDVVTIAAPPHGARELIVKGLKWRYRVTGNTLLPDAQIRGILQTAATPEDAVQNMSAAYQHDGYFLVAVKAMSGGRDTIWIQVVQGQITEERVPSGVEAFYRGLTGRQDLKRDALLRRTVLAQAYAGRNGEKLQANFSPSETPGGSALAVETPRMPGAHAVSGSLQLGNTGTRYASRYTAGLNMVVHPGAGLEFTGNFVDGLASWNAASRGSQYRASGLGISTITPWGTYGLSYQKTRYRIGDVAAPLYPQGDVESLAGSGNQLLLVTDASRLALNESVVHVANTQAVYGGAYQLADQSYNYASVGLQYSQGTHFMGSNGQMSLGLTLNKGLTGLRGSLNVEQAGVPTPRFRSLNYAFNLVQPLPQGAAVQFGPNGQRAFDTLPQQQQWVLGGFGNLSAYFPGVIVGDSGYSGRVTLQSPSRTWRGWAAVASVFLETGGASYSYAAPGTEGWQRLTDWGVGVNVQGSRGTSVSLVAARPLGESNVSRAVRDANHVSLFVTLQQSF